MIDLDLQLRNLAKSPYWQSLCIASKKSNIQLFENTSNFSGIQVRLLYWLEVYRGLYEELSTFEDNLLTENVINNNFRCDCYLIYRNKKQEFLWRKYRQEEANSRMKANKKKKFKHPGKESNIQVELRRE